MSFYCTLCVDYFESARNLQQHMLKLNFTHVGDSCGKFCACSICEHGFFHTPEELHNHIQQNHSWFLEILHKEVTGSREQLQLEEKRKHIHQASRNM